ncbi:MAG: hypothetical protein QOC56_2936 [Alphaproteobacteria bacterium]|nr:hypothetical protein [Alphaproteobacteria bacterium]
MDVGSSSRAARASAVTGTAGRCVQSDDALGYSGIDQDRPVGSMALLDGEQDGGDGEQDRGACIARNDAGDRAHAAALETGMVVESGLTGVVCGLAVGTCALVTTAMTAVAIVAVMLMMRRCVRMMLMRRLRVRRRRAHDARRRQMSGHARTPRRAADDQRGNDCPHEGTMHHPAHPATIKAIPPRRQGGRPDRCHAPLTGRPSRACVRCAMRIRRGWSAIGRNSAVLFVSLGRRCGFRCAAWDSPPQ